MPWCPGTRVVVYSESIKPELKTRPIYECRYVERLKTKVEESLEVIGVPSIFKLIRKPAALVRVLSTFSFRWSENTT